MKRSIITLCFSLTFIFGVNLNLSAQDDKLKDYYVGFIPSFLAEPYDTIDALEVNSIPLLIEFRVGEKRHIGIQLRPIANYRFSKVQTGFSQVGGTAMVNKYFMNAFGEDRKI